MKNNIKIYTLLLVAALTISGCYKDQGSYNYSEINEVQIQGINKDYVVLKGISTLELTPTIVGTLDPSGTGDYAYRWDITGTSGDVVLNGTVIGTQKDLKYEVNLDQGSYNIYLRVRDNKSGIETKAVTNLRVIYPYTRGFIVSGEDKEGNAIMDMIGMPTGMDTIILKNLLKDSEMPRLKGVRKFIHTGGISSLSSIFVWALGGDGAYFANPETLKSSPKSIFRNFVYTSVELPEQLYPTEVAPISTVGGKLTTIGSSTRAVRCNNGWIFRSSLIEGEAYGNPLNKLTNGPLFNTFPHIFYAPGYFGGAITFYNTDDDRFVTVSTFGSIATAPSDAANGVFNWNNKPLGLKMIHGANTRNTDGGSTNGNSFAIMRNEAMDDVRIYKFYASSAPTKRDSYNIKLDIATNFNNAGLYAFASTRTLLFYTVGNKLYAYDYNKNNEKINEINIGNGADEITMIYFDIQSINNVNDFYVATYNETTGGTLRKFKLGTDPNTVTLIPEENAVWSGLSKVKHIEYRNF